VTPSNERDRIQAAKTFAEDRGLSASAIVSLKNANARDTLHLQAATQYKGLSQTAVGYLITFAVDAKKVREVIMLSANAKVGAIKNMRRWPILCAVLAIILLVAPTLWALPFTQARIIIEVNATAGDAGIQIFVDAEGWKRLEVFDPNGQKIFDVTGSGSVGMQGVTELFFESAEPSFDEQSLDELFARFPQGNYDFKGTTVDGQTLNGKATLKHNIPAGPEIVSPGEGEVLNANEPVVIDWQPVTSPFPGTVLPVNIVAYQVIVERVKPQPLRVFSVNLQATTTQVTVSPEFLQSNADYNVEVLAIDASGNQTISESSFKTR
jgi:hypothetical protein